ncbi:MAG: hypothetical protein ACI8W7_000633 [Gammaproteobacteria bacterium]
MILREGFIPLSVTTALAVVVAGTVGVPASVPLWMVLAWLLRVYWEHRPVLPAQPKGVLSPIHGRVIGVDSYLDSWLQRSAMRIRIGIPFPGIVPLRCPIEAKVMDLYTRIGTFGTTQRACTADESPDCYGQWLQTDEGEDVVFVISSNLPLSRARFDQAPGERVGQGARSGFFYFASVVDILLPADSSVMVAVDDAVDAGESVLAQLSRR